MQRVRIALTKIRLPQSLLKTPGAKSSATPTPASSPLALLVGFTMATRDSSDLVRCVMLGLLAVTWPNIRPG